MRTVQDVRFAYKHRGAYNRRRPCRQSVWKHFRQLRPKIDIRVNFWTSSLYANIVSFYTASVTDGLGACRRM